MPLGPPLWILLLATFCNGPPSHSMKVTHLCGHLVMSLEHWSEQLTQDLQKSWSLLFSGDIHKSSPPGHPESRRQHG